MEKEFDKIFKEIIAESANTVNGETLENGFNSIAAIIGLQGESFKIISSTFLSELEKQLKDSNTVLEVLDAFKQSNIDISEFVSSVDQICDEIDNNLPHVETEKRDFLKRIIYLMTNRINEYIASDIVKIPIELCHEDAIIPTYANATDAGMDIYALEDIEVLPGETALIPTGLKVAIPVGYELQVRPKSGRALKTKLRVANSPGTIDSGYRDEIKVIIENIEPPIADIGYEFTDNGEIVIKSILHGRPFVIEKGQKFAQLVLNKVPSVSFFKVENVGEYEGDRGGGFGSTGV